MLNGDIDYDPCYSDGYGDSGDLAYAASCFRRNRRSASTKYRKICKHCGETGLHWENTEQNITAAATWRLYKNTGGTIHTCANYYVDLS